MFVRQSKYDKLEADLQKACELAKHYKTKYGSLELRYEILEKKSIQLAKEIHEKGGREFLDKAVILDEDTIKKMLQLCHPNKHQGKQIAVEVTQMLLKMKGK